MQGHPARGVAGTLCPWCTVTRCPLRSAKTRVVLSMLLESDFLFFKFHFKVILGEAGHEFSFRCTVTPSFLIG